MTIDTDATTSPSPPLLPCPICAAEFDGFVEGYALAKGWEAPHTWDIYDKRFGEIRDVFDECKTLLTVASMEL